MLNEFYVLHKTLQKLSLGDSQVKKNNPERYDTIVSITGET